MAAVNITINGVICDLYGRTITGPVKIVGEAMYSDLGVGGGPVIPPPSGGLPPSDAHPEHPIWLPPTGGGGSPPGFWGGGPHPMPPIQYPPGQGPIIDPGPGQPPGGQPPAEAGGNWQWGWNVSSGWHPVYVPNPGGKPQPVPPPGGGNGDPNAPRPDHTLPGDLPPS